MEVRAEVEQQPQVYEHQGSGLTIVTRRWEPGRGRSPQTTNKDRILSDLESLVLNRVLTPPEADAEYGRKAPGAGRPRRFPDFASWLRDRIAVAEAPATERAILRRMAGLRRIAGPKRAAAARVLNAQLDKTGREYADKLREALRELEAAAA